MTFQTIVFYALAGILLLSSLRVITAKDPVHAALFLVLSFFTGAGLWVLLQAEFLAISLVLIYVGAVMVLFLFVVMMLDINFEKLREGFWKTLPSAGFVAALVALELVLLLTSRDAGLNAVNALPAVAEGYSNTKELGKVLYTNYVYPFEIAAMILLVALIAAVALTMRKRKPSKYVDPGMQAKVRRQDRIRMVAMAAEQRNTTGEPPASN
ncbi:MAG: NADH-quinone oxidoreductase subunit J [Chitinivorax sp.]|jgi:NADH-quinone oxidoreductase subunit J